MNLSPANIPYWLAAIRAEGIGPLRFRRCIDQFGELKKVFSASHADLQALGFSEREIRSLKNPDWRRIEKDISWCETHNCQLIALDDERYPSILKEIVDAPLLLFVRGNVELLLQPQLALVGTRNPTNTGRALAEQFASRLSQVGFVITSGLALGIDGACHRGALSAGGKTIAVCGTGLSHTYPRSHYRLAEEIIAKGAVISEFPPDTPPKAKYFPMRNRIISGLSLGVLVIEAALKSGSLITARLAAEQGREVFALPGSIHNPLARGCHHLIQQGAKLVEMAEDILEELGTFKTVDIPKKSQKNLNLQDLQKVVLEKIGYEITTLDVIIMQSGLTSGEVSSILLALELEGYITHEPGGYVRNL